MKAFLNSKHNQCIIYKLLSEKVRFTLHEMERGIRGEGGKEGKKREGEKTLHFLTFDADRFYTRAVDTIKRTGHFLKTAAARAFTARKYQNRPIQVTHENTPRKKKKGNKRRRSRWVEHVL